MSSYSCKCNLKKIVYDHFFLITYCFRFFSAYVLHKLDLTRIFVSGEVERLLREYTQNQEMVRNIGSHYYQIIYPVQLRQHKKMGISTREIGSSKVRKARSTVCHAHFISFHVSVRHVRHLLECRVVL